MPFDRKFQVRRRVMQHIANRLITAVKQLRQRKYYGREIDYDLF